jgi:hypothetical protein
MFGTAESERKEAIEDGKFFGNWASIVWIIKERGRNDQYKWGPPEKSFRPKLRRKLVEIVQFSKRQSCPCFGLRALLFCKCY